MQLLRRTLGLSSVIAIVVGSIIGSGIFMKPSVMLAQVGSPLLLLLVWVLAGIVVLFGALTNAEAASMFPETGGQYVFFRAMYGERFAFLYGWAAFAVFNTAGNASIAYVCSQYADYFLHLPVLSPATEKAMYLHIPFVGNIYPLEQIGIKVLTALLIALFTWINIRSVEWGAGIQRFLTSLKVIAILLLVAGVFFSGKTDTAHISQFLPNGPSGLSLGIAFMAAASGAFWAYDGWNNITFIAGEIRNPQKNIAKSLWVGITVCLIIYLLVNFAFILVLSPPAMASSSFIAADAASSLWGSTGALLMVLLVVASTLGTTNSNVLSTARVTFALGAANPRLRFAGQVHPRFRTPVNALLLNAGWSVLLVFSGSFDMLTDMLIFVSWLFYGMSALGIFILRRKMPNAERPYKVWGYPVVPALFVLFTLFFLISVLYTDVVNYLEGKSPMMNSVFGLLITLAGLPLYWYCKRHSRA